MKRFYLLAILLIFLILCFGCSLSHPLPSDGVWYNEEYKISFECKKNRDSNYTQITNIEWNSKKDVLFVHLGYGGEIYFYCVDEDGNEKYLLEGRFKYVDNEFIVDVLGIAEPFDITGVITEVSDTKIVFNQKDRGRFSVLRQTKTGDGSLS